MKQLYLIETECGCWHYKYYPHHGYLSCPTMGPAKGFPVDLGLEARHGLQKVVYVGKQNFLQYSRIMASHLEEAGVALEYMGESMLKANEAFGRLSEAINEEKVNR